MVKYKYKQHKQGPQCFFLIHPEDWVKNNFPSSNNLTSNHPFTPTTIMEVGNTKYCFVIENATYNKNKKYNTVFNVSTNQVVKNNISKHLVKLPINKKLNNVRFDIDSSSYITVTLPIQSITPSLSPYDIITTGMSLNVTYNPIGEYTPPPFYTLLNGQTLTATATGTNIYLSNFQAFLSSFFMNFYYNAETTTITLYDLYNNVAFTIVLGLT